MLLHMNYFTVFFFQGSVKTVNKFSLCFEKSRKAKKMFDFPLF